MLVEQKPDQRRRTPAPSKQEGEIPEPLLGPSRYARVIVIGIVVGFLCFGAYRVLSPSHYRGGEVVEKAAPVIRSGKQRDRTRAARRCAAHSRSRRSRSRTSGAISFCRRSSRPIRARTVKVLPPVAGRVVNLKVQLGERVAARAGASGAQLRRSCASIFRRRKGAHHVEVDQTGARSPARSRKKRWCGHQRSRTSAERLCPGTSRVRAG